MKFIKIYSKYSGLHLEIKEKRKPNSESILLLGFYK